MYQLLFPRCTLGVASLVPLLLLLLLLSPGVAALTSLFDDRPDIIDSSSPLVVSAVHSHLSSCPFVLLAYASSCGHCRASATYFSTAAAHTAAAMQTTPASAVPSLFVAINCEDHDRACDEMGVEAVPTYFFYTPLGRPGDGSAAPRGERVPGSVRGRAESISASLTRDVGGGAVMRATLMKNHNAQGIEREMRRLWGSLRPADWAVSDTEACAQLQQYLSHTKAVSIAQHKAGTGNSSAEAFVESTVFDPADVACALHHTLTVEVPWSWRLGTSPEKLRALRDFLAAVAAALPGIGADSVLQDAFAAGADEQPAVEDWLRAVQAAGIPCAVDKHTGQLSWSLCRGSSPKYRGFPCGMWLLYHALTVNYRPPSTVVTGGAAAAAVDGFRSPYVNTDPGILYIILAYVRHYFSCTECRDHFLHFKPREGVDVVLQLWRTHNVANRELAKTPEGQDPRVPKQQFPTVACCRRCHRGRKDSSEFVEDAVAQYLRRRYRWLPPASPQLLVVPPRGSEYSALYVILSGFMVLLVGAVCVYLGARRTRRKIRRMEGRYRE